MNRRPVIVLGHKGMLGQMVKSYFSSRAYSVHTIPYRFNAAEKESFIDAIQEIPDAIVFNCIGKIKQKTEEDAELFWSNSILPLQLAECLLPTQTLVHPSTDCIFDGVSSAPYQTDHKHFATDSYGWSKRLGEVALMNRKNTIILRVSIIGPDNSDHPAGLLGWFLSNEPENKLLGYDNHLWNGITTLEWCKLVEDLLIVEDLTEKNCILLQAGTREYYTKYQMLCLFQIIFKTNFNIERHLTPDPFDRRLVPQLVVKPLREQLSELMEYMEQGKFNG